MPIVKYPVRRALWKALYNYLTHRTQTTSLTFLNYGYCDPHAPPLELQPDEEGDRYPIQLYHHVASAVDLSGLDVMEVSCGHGGGAAYIARHLNARSVLGIDYNTKAIEFCRAHHAAPNLSFEQGNALALAFDDQSFDIIVNIEASHCYGDIQKFLNEVFRLLRPGGYFLFADFRLSDRKQGTLDKEIGASGLEVLNREDITENVGFALDASSSSRLQSIEEHSPKILKNFSRQFAGVKGSTIYEKFRSGNAFYVSYVLRKPDV
jgi:ubiquinone/menaquinone biosynthesis C-methylase UbiE